jgi:hypothetical protein
VCLRALLVLAQVEVSKFRLFLLMADVPAVIARRLHQAAMKTYNSKLREINRESDDEGQADDAAADAEVCVCVCVCVRVCVCLGVRPDLLGLSCSC